MLLAAMAALVLSACNMNQCQEVNCLNGGACNDGTCICPEGYTGEYCENEVVDPCDNVGCLNGGVCVDGSCVCPNGYEGPNCEIETRQKFIRSWNGNESCSQSTDIYSFSITAGASINEVTISNIYDSGINVTAVVSENTITIPNQAFGTGTITGNGTWSTQQTMSVNFTIFTGSEWESCTLSCS